MAILAKMRFQRPEPNLRARGRVDQGILSLEHGHEGSLHREMIRVFRAHSAKLS